MVSPHEEELVVLARAKNEVEAASLVTALSAYEIDATATGGFTAGFRAEAPGDVQVVVKQSDVERAKEALARIRDDQASIDWSSVDVGQPEDNPQ